LDAANIAGRYFPARTEAFGYTCNRCLRCCHHKHIQVNPYELARVARNRGVTTRESRQRWTLDEQGTVLKQTDAGACVFLGDGGCTIHADRPLVCRLYPLGRHVSPDGSERFSHLEPHPQTAGEYTGKGTIADFLAAQDAAPYMDAADDYFFWLCRAQPIAGGATPPDPAAPSEGGVAFAQQCLDMDLAIDEHCEQQGTPAPQDIEARRRLHLQILDNLLARWAAGGEL
jgi:Fe-S-cluster containining protein